MDDQFSHNDVLASIFSGDALDFLQTLEPASVDLVFTSPPYCIGKEYDTSYTAAEFLDEHLRILPEIIDKLKLGGSICWQVGHHCREGVVVPLDALIYSSALNYPDLKLRNRIVWTFGHGIHENRRFSGRHETILWFTKGNEYTFDLDAVRVPQKYPGKRHYKGPSKGEWSGNPLGKNPGDVWDIPNVKAGHPEKTSHPCQFPTALVRRFIRALTIPGQLVVDPYSGSGSTALASVLEGRNFAGAELEPEYVSIIKERLRLLTTGETRVRDDTPPRSPAVSEAVAIRPPHFAIFEASEGTQ